MKVFKSLLLAALALTVFASCSSDDDDDKVAEKDTSSVQVVIRTSNTPTVRSASVEVGALNLMQLYINIAEIEFDIDDDMEDRLPGNSKVYSDVKLKGPFPINLLSDKASSGLVLATTNVPNGIYEEIEFEFDVYKGDNPEFKDLRGSTVYALGTFTIEGEDVPFIIKSDEELEIELEYEKEPLVLDGDNSKVFIDLNLGSMISQLIDFTAMDFKNATREADGSILISEDSNKKILEKFEDVIEDAFEALEDANDDDNDDDDDDDD